MEWFESFVLPQSGHHLKLLELLAVMTYLIHLPYVGVVMGTTALSMWLSFSNREIPQPLFDRFAGELIERFLSNRYAMVIFGIFPLLILPLIYTQWFVGAGAGNVIVYIPSVIPLVAVAFFLVNRYATSFPSRKDHFGRHMLYGLAAVGLFKLSYLVLLGSVVRLQDPEKWYRVKNVLIMLLNFNVIWKFAFFLHAAAVVTGVAILFFFFRWPGQNTEADPEYASLVKKFGAGIALAFSFALPVFNLLYVFTTPDVAFDNGVYLLAASVVVVALVAVLFLVGTLSKARPRFAATTLGLVIVMFGLSATADVRSMARANFEHARLLEIAAEEKKLTREAEIEGRLQAAGGAEVGAEVFNNVCMQCHRMDEKLVGPPLATVLPNYAGDVESLKAFISNPVKKNPEYPPMPNPGLSPSQIDAVANYLLEQIGADTGAPAGGNQGH